MIIFETNKMINGIRQTIIKKTIVTMIGLPEFLRKPIEQLNMYSSFGWIVFRKNKKEHEATAIAKAIRIALKIIEF